jgi:(S)-mandelate dehydrogenase
VLPITISDWRAAARKTLPRFVYDYLEGGAEEEHALRRNLAAFDEWFLIPRVLNDVSARSVSLDIFGEATALPVIIAPTGLNGLIRPRGDEMLARAAVNAGIPFVLSTAANAGIAEIVRASGRAPWFQLYVLDRQRANTLVATAEIAGCPALVVTVDVPLGGKRCRDLRNGVTIPFRRDLKLILDAARRPSWVWRYLTDDDALVMPCLQITDGCSGAEKQAQLLARAFDASFTWDDLARLRDRWHRYLIIKGLLSVEDAERALRLGVDGIVVSNHGGRQLDGAPGALDVLSGIVAAVGQRAAVFLDGGIRNGEDVLKAIALGAKAVLVGRAPLYGLAAAGEEGVTKVIGQFKDDLLRGMALLGCAELNDVDRSRIRSVEAIRRSHL